MTTPLPIKAGTAIFACVGLLILYLAALDIYDNWQFLNKAEHAVGTVQDITSRTTQTGTSNTRRYSTSSLAFIRFKDSSGAIIGFEHSYGLWENTLAPGDNVDVAYDQRQPEAAKVTNFGALWAGNIAMVICGAMFLLAGFAVNRVFGRSV